ncbi:hypothetical protein EDEG_00205 [Edhazardia aedis USNM 41457]|uniref:V-type ATPase, F subunit n=1 Tax=Edhazardia aedis (strain USNM 41457) TaxID=1003232 RepID=J9D7H6_EDHAE|nr:hypothetical protein EDEG_00205 [Edhazardia aedis USNM 41457]|eukprot:EJW03474.1 hypothetical protein EDEG_00205 [Edhazardia aedis USNM 41457]
MNTRRLIAIISDDETLTGFSLTGLENPKKQPVFFSVNDETPEEDLLKIYRDIMARDDVAVLFIADFALAKISIFLENEPKKLLPSIMEIPSKFGFGI